MAGYKLVGTNKAYDEDYCDDGEIGGGARILNYISSENIENISIFVVRYYGGQHLGPRHYEIIWELTGKVCAAMEKGEFFLSKLPLRQMLENSQRKPRKSRITKVKSVQCNIPSTAFRGCASRGQSVRGGRLPPLGTFNRFHSLDQDAVTTEEEPLTAGSDWGKDDWCNASFNEKPMYPSGQDDDNWSVEINNTVMSGNAEGACASNLCTPAAVCSNLEK